MPWIDSGLSISSGALNSASDACVFGADLFVATFSGSLYQSVGGSGVLTLVAVGGGMSLYVFNDTLYSWKPSNATLWEWSGVAWVLKATGLFGGADSWAFKSLEGVLYCANDQVLYKWDNIAALILLHDFGSDALDIDYLVPSFGNATLYIGSTSGFLFGHDDFTDYQAAPDLGGVGGSRPIIYDNFVYGGMSGSRLYKWNDVDAWGEIIPEYQAGSRIRGILDFGGRIYAGVARESGITAGGQLLSWATGEVGWTLEAEPLGAFPNIYTLFLFDSKIWGLAVAVGGNGPSKLYYLAASSIVVDAMLPAFVGI